MGITFSPECGSSFEESERGERKRVRSTRGPGRPRKDGTESAPLKSGVRGRVPSFEDFDDDSDDDFSDED